MTDTAIHSNWVTVYNELPIDAYLAEPAEAGAFPGIVVIQEIFGVNEHIRSVTERIAQLGYVAIAPAIYQRLAPGFEAGYSPEEIKLGRQYKEQTNATELLGDVQAAIDFLKTRPTVKAAIGCIGFCFGGHVAYLAATLPDIKATASFYGAGLPNWTPGGGEPTLSRTPQITGILYAFFGNEDASIPNSDVEQIETALQAHQIPHQIFRYDGAGHGFFCDRRPDYRPEVAAEAWQEVQQLFQRELKAIGD
jgi:carboxymethylenebutenolidase